jgi:homoserine kinase
MKLIARVPATSANLGPGFDCFALALDLCNEVRVDTEAQPGVTWEGEGAEELPTDGSDLISRSIARIAGEHGAAPPTLALHGINRIPLARGLGSSAAATVAGVVLADALLALRGSPAEHLDAAAEIEGHPDNAAAAIYGGFTIAWEPPRRGIRLEPHADLSPVMLIPEHIRLPTLEARRALARDVSLTDAVANISRAAIGVVAFTSDPALLGTALEDRLHQKQRLALVPLVRDVFERLGSDGVPVCVSGAGPSLLAFESSEHPVPNPGKDWRVMRVAPRRIGAEVVGS